MVPSISGATCRPVTTRLIGLKNNCGEPNISCYCRVAVLGPRHVAVFTPKHVAVLIPRHVAFLVPRHVAVLLNCYVAVLVPRHVWLAPIYENDEVVPISMCTVHISPYPEILAAMYSGTFIFLPFNTILKIVDIIF